MRPRLTSFNGTHWAVNKHDPQRRQEQSEAFLSNGMDQQEADDKHHHAGFAMN